MNRNTIILIASVIILSIVVMTALPFLGLLAIHSYDSPVATIESVETGVSDSTLWTVEKGLSSALIYPDTSDLWDAFSSCGLKFTIQSAPVVYGEAEKIDEIVEYVVDDSAKTNMTKTWEVHEIELRMGVTIETYQGGLQASPSAIFWIELENNDASIFSTADEQYAYFVQVYTNQPADIVGVITSYGEESGWSFDRTAIGTDPVPQFVLDAGYTPAAEDCAHVKFPVELLSAAPTTIVATSRAESRITLHISIMVILFGMWERVVPYVEWVPPVIPDLLGDLVAFLIPLIYLIIGFASTIVIFMKVPDVKIKIIAVVLVWAVLGIPLGWYAFLGAG